jgi:hypothetical protein
MSYRDEVVIRADIVNDPGTQSWFEPLHSGPLSTGVEARDATVFPPARAGGMMADGVLGAAKRMG